MLHVVRNALLCKKYELFPKKPLTDGAELLRIAISELNERVRNSFADKIGTLMEFLPGG